VRIAGTIAEGDDVKSAAWPGHAEPLTGDVAAPLARA